MTGDNCACLIQLPHLFIFWWVVCNLFLDVWDFFYYWSISQMVFIGWLAESRLWWSKSRLSTTEVLKKCRAFIAAFLLNTMLCSRERQEGLIDTNANHQPCLLLLKYFKEKFFEELAMHFCWGWDLQLHATKRETFVSSHRSYSILMTSISLGKN